MKMKIEIYISEKDLMDDEPIGDVEDMIRAEIIDQIHFNPPQFTYTEIDRSKDCFHGLLIRYMVVYA